MGKESPKYETYSGPYQQIGWDIGVEMRFRWRRGPQFGERTVSYPHVIDPEGARHKLEPQRGPWTWYSWRFKRIEGVELRFPPALTFRSDQEKETVGIELENRPDIMTPRT